MRVGTLLLVMAVAVIVLGLACGRGKKSSSSGDSSGVVVATVAVVPPAGSLPAIIATQVGTAGQGSVPAQAGAPPTAAAIATQRPGTPAPAGGSASPLATVADNYKGLKTYRVNIVTEGPNTPKQEVKMDVVLPDKYHLVVTPPGTGSPNIEQIIIGNDTYMKVGPVPWTKQQGGGSTSTFNARGIGGIVESLRTVGATRGASTTVNGKSCQLYTYASSTGQNEVCVADNLPLRLVQQQGPTKSTMVFTDFNANIDIKAP